MCRAAAISAVIILQLFDAGRLSAQSPPADSPVAVAAASGLTVDQSPAAFEAVGDDGRPWLSAEHVGKKIVVFYFYPGDFTGGCIKQAQAFREGLTRLEALDVELVGVSGDSVATHQLFKSTYGLKHTLLADPDGALAKQLGMPVQKGAKVRTRGPDGQPLLDGAGKSIMIERGATLPRWTIVVGKDGKLLSKRMQVNPATDADEVAKLVEAAK